MSAAEELDLPTPSSSSSHNSHTASPAPSPNPISVTPASTLGGALGRLRARREAGGSGSEGLRKVRPHHARISDALDDDDASEIVSEEKVEATSKSRCQEDPPSPLLRFALNIKKLFLIGIGLALCIFDIYLGKS